MRFDLTHAAFRVLQRGAERYLPTLASEIGAAKILIALFEEEECRAAQWLTESGLSLDKFSYDFDLAGSPDGKIAATLPTPSRDLSSPMGNYGVRFYSIYSEITNLSETNHRNQTLFYLEDLPVHVGRLSKDLETALEMVQGRIDRRDLEQRHFSTAGGGIATVSAPSGDVFFSSVPLATEHLLLATAFDTGDVGLWLRDHGLDPNTLLERIEQLATRQENGPGCPALGNGNSVAVPDLFADLDGTAKQNLASPIASLPVDKEDLPQQSDAPASPDSIHSKRICRLLDASANRAREALRVLEDYARFILDDRKLTGQLKSFRHELRKILEPLSPSLRLSARDTEQDVGTEIEGQGEYRRENVRDVLVANFARLQESLRSLEEFSKITVLGDEPIFGSDAPRRLERLRYQSYTLQKIICEDHTDNTRILHDARLYALLDGQADEEHFSVVVRALIEGGVDLIQLRDKNLDDRTLLGRAKTLRTLIESSKKRVLFVMNDRPDLAKLAGADGVHVGQEELTVEEVREIVGREMLVGVSTHNIDQARKAVEDRADYIGIGPVFPSTTKSFDGVYETLPGTDYLREVANEIVLPAFAIGGIAWDNLDEVLDTGIRRIAVGSALLQADDLGQAARRLRERLLV